MLSFEKDFKPYDERLKSIILKKDAFDEVIALSLDMHALTHPAAASGAESTFEEDILKNFTDKDYKAGYRSIFPVAWQLWHITRIEDIVGNIIIRNSEQIFNKDWQNKIGAIVTDTGNAMSAKEAQKFSNDINIAELLRYRIAVAKQSRETIKSLTADDLHKKASKTALERIIHEGGLVMDEKSSWLAEFWGGRTFGGLILLPFIRHQVMHLTNCMKLRDKFSL